MHKYLFPLLFGAVILSGSGNWVEGSTLGVSADSPASYQVLTIDTYSLPDAIPTPGEWHTVDISGLVPPGTKAIHINVMFAITNGQTNELCAMVLHLRKTGTTPGKTEVAKVTSAHVVEGQRDNYSDWVAVDDGKFDYLWIRGTAGNWPKHCAYGLAMKVSAWLK